MSYPPPLYAGDAGEISATTRSAEQPPDLAYPNGTTVSYLATGAATGGLFGLYRWDMAAGPGGPGPHFHRTIAESFFILSGVVQIYDGTSWADAGSGDFAHVPPGGIHGFRNESGAPASMLLHFAPGAPREGYFEGLMRLAEMDEAQRAAFYRDHDNHWL